MTIIATIRQTDGQVLCAYKMKPEPKSNDKFDFSGAAIMEIGERRFIVHTVMKEFFVEDWEAEGHMPCSECGKPVPFPGWDVWTNCPTCGAKVRSTHRIVGFEG